MKGQFDVMSTLLYVSILIALISIGVLWYAAVQAGTSDDLFEPRSRQIAVRAIHLPDWQCVRFGQAISRCIDVSKVSGGYDSVFGDSTISVSYISPTWSFERMVLYERMPVVIRERRSEEEFVNVLVGDQLLFGRLIVEVYR